MRTEQEVTELRDHVQRLIEQAAKELRTRNTQERYSELMGIHNYNSQINMTLNWVLGEDTQISFSYGTRGAGMKPVKL